MASPVIINSSSPNSLRLPTITPPSRRGSVSKNATLSSPGLPSPSTFVKAKASVLKPGSRAQAIPASASLGFASAASLWRDNRFKFDDEVKAVQTVAEKTADIVRPKDRGDVQREATGKLKKPKKPKKTTPDEPRLAQGRVASGGGMILEFQDFICDDAAAGVIPPKAAAHPPKQVNPIRRPSVDFSEYALGVYNLGMQTQAPAAILATERSRKKATSSKASKDSGNTVGKPRKRKAKSEAVILNSDDPLDDNAVATEHVAKTAVKRAPKAQKSKTKQGRKAKPSTDGVHEDVGKVAQWSKETHLLKKDGMATEKSAYFKGAPTADRLDAQAGTELSAKPVEQRVEPHQTIEDDTPTESAAPRRLDWTPVKDTDHTRRDTCRHSAGPPSVSVASPKVQLTDLLGDFGYIDANTKMPPVERTTSGEAVTKRRRIELADAATADPASRKNAQPTNEESEAKQTKKPAGRKKLLTITALATSAYQPALDPSAEQSTVSEFFAPRKEKDAPAKDAASAAEKPKKPRKPRKKKGDAVDGDQSAVAQPKKAKKAKVKSNDTDDPLTKLYSPARATAQMNQQGFLFGTSSQLAVDGSHVFVRDMQAAVQASEIDVTDRPQLETYRSQMRSSDAMPSQLLPTPRKTKSCATVPTAPHGTCLSLEQAHRELWCVSSRNHDGGFLRELPKRDLVPERPPSLEDGNEGNVGPVEQQSTNLEAPDHGALPQNAKVQVEVPQIEVETAAAGLEELADTLAEARDERQVVIDAQDTSPAQPAEFSEDSPPAHNHDSERAAFPIIQELHQELDTAIAPDHEHGQNDDSWMLISSDGPEPSAYHTPPAHSFSTGASPIKIRSALQPLNVNASMPVLGKSKDVATDRARMFSTTASDSKPKSPSSKPRGRPRKDATAAKSAVTSPKKRGRPSKRSVIASDPSPEATKFRKPKATVSASQPLQSPSGWLNVDEIYDSDSPVTPSPPRRRASSSPRGVPALDLGISGLPIAKLSEKAPAVKAASSAIKPGEPQWHVIREQVFPKISTTIRDTPRNNDSSKPSWYQKILMYDPITLEDLTAWLNEQGLRIQVQKQKLKAKKKGRKKKDAEGNVVEEDSVVEWETHEEALQPWMVQKWCEERSICCVWAGGGWGGRARH